MPYASAERAAGTAKERRDRPKLIRFSEDELRAVSDRARACGRPVACYIREASLGAIPRARRTHASDLVIRRLTRVATRLASLADDAAAKELSGAADFRAAVEDVLDAIRQLD